MIRCFRMVVICILSLGTPCSMIHTVTMKERQRATELDSNSECTLLCTASITSPTFRAPIGDPSDSFFTWNHLHLAPILGIQRCSVGASNPANDERNLGRGTIPHQSREGGVALGYRGSEGDVQRPLQLEAVLGLRRRALQVR